jgi:DNA-binding response OmpR family regulator
VHRLRRKLEGGDVRVATVRGLGYSLQLHTRDASP